MPTTAAASHTLARMDDVFAPDLFAEGGALAETLPGYEPREEQAELAQAVADALSAGEHLLAEAGTGTGKSLAYLIPALASGRKVVIATATKALQEQLLTKDVPIAAAALRREVKVAVLKGRQNYLCRKALDGFGLLGSQLLQREEDAADFERLLPWFEETETGDRAELAFEPSDTLWSELAVGADGCLGRKCPFAANCFSEQARRECAGGRPHHRQPRPLLRGSRSTRGDRRLDPARARGGRLRRGTPARGHGRVVARRRRLDIRSGQAGEGRCARLPRGQAFPYP